MKKGGRLQVSEGFTIIETLIVLAVTGGLFLIAAAYISGKQDKTMFSTSVNSLKQQLEQVINETQSGYYPDTGNFTCSSGGAGTIPTITSVAADSTTQGTNGGCIFMGKVLFFDPASARSESYIVFPMAGNRQASGVDVTTIQQARPTAIAQASSGNAPNDYTTNNLTSGLNFKGKMGNFGKPLAIGLINNLTTGATATSPGGVADIALYAYDTTSLAAGAATTRVVDVLNSASGSATTVTQVTGSDTIQFCVASGTTNQSGLFTIDAGLHVSLDIKQGQTCA